MHRVLNKLPAAAFLLGEQSANENIFYRRASFCVVCNDGADKIAYNALTRELVKLSRREAELLSMQSVSVSDDSLPLIRGYYLVPLDCDEEKLCDGMHAIMRAAAKTDRYRSFTVFTTTDCNARCFYCYELCGKKVTMSEDTAEKVAEFIIAASKGGAVNITWYGGEPLMNTKAMDIISTSLFNSNIEYTSVLATNASLIDDEIAAKAKNLWHVQKAQVTLDGPPQVYDRIKAYNDKKHSFFTVLDSIEKLLSADIKVNIRLNVDVHNMDSMHELCDILAKRFAGARGLNVYSALLFDCDGAKRPVGDAESRMDVAKKVIALEDKCADIGLLKPRKLRRGASVSFCKADAEDALVITAEGKFVKCDFFTDDRFVGDVYDGIDAEKLDSQRREFSTRVLCKGCSAYPVCMRISGCPTGACDEARRFITEERLVRSVRYAYKKECKMIYKIADFNIHIKYSDPRTETFLKDYISDDAKNVDFSIELCDSDIDREVKDAIDIAQKLRFSRGYLERTAILRKLCAMTLDRGAFLMHGALIEYNGEGYLFCAPSGVGKTTHILLWQKLFGKENVRIINGDKPMIRVIDGEVYAYGTPWCGKEGYNINARTKLKSICFIERANENSISALDELSAVQKILAQIMVVDSADLGAQLSLVDNLFGKVGMYCLRCNKDIDAAKVAYDGMR